MRRKFCEYKDLLIDMNYFIGVYLRSPMFGLFILVISCILFDFSSQACLNPCEALLYDICKGTSKQSTCFFVYSFMTSIGMNKKNTRNIVYNQI